MSETLVDETTDPTGISHKILLHADLKVATCNFSSAHVSRKYLSVWRKALEIRMRRLSFRPETPGKWLSRQSAALPDRAAHANTLIARNSFPYRYATHSDRSYVCVLREKFTTTAICRSG